MEFLKVRYALFGSVPSWYTRHEDALEGYWKYVVLRVKHCFRSAWHLLPFSEESWLIGGIAPVEASRCLRFRGDLLADIRRGQHFHVRASASDPWQHLLRLGHLSLPDNSAIRCQLNTL